MSTLFEEAITDAKKLRTMAEENAKNKIIDIMAPKIRVLIEQELMDDEEEISLDELLPAEIISEPVSSEPTSLQTVSISVDGEANIALSTGEIEVDKEVIDDEEEDEEMIMGLSAESVRALAAVIRNPRMLNSKRNLNENLIMLQRKIRRFKRLLEYAISATAGSTLRESARKYYTRMLKEMISLRKDVILTEGKVGSARLHTKYNWIVKEMKTMSRRHGKTLFDRLFIERKNRRLNETSDEGDTYEGDLEEFDIVFDEEELTDLGIEEPDVLADLSADVSIEGGEEEEEVEEEVVEAYLRELFEQDEEIDVEEEVEDEGPIEDVGEVIPVADAEAALEDLGAALGLDLTVGEEEEAEVEVEEEEVMEIDEGALRRELRRMRHLREQDDVVATDPYLDHGGEELGDVILDVSEEDLINALADELGPVDETEVTVENRRRLHRARKVAEARTRRSSRGRRPKKSSYKNEGRQNRALKKKLVEYRTAVGTLHNQLTEMNLFNAKLLYVNKLMQNRNLTTKQQRAIVEALDNAKTLREAKLLYKSLTTSLNKRGAGRSLTEGRNARTLGSSSRSIRSASATKNGNEVDRWAVLAGINKD